MSFSRNRKTKWNLLYDKLISVFLFRCLIFILLFEKILVDLSLIIEPCRIKHKSWHWKKKLMLEKVGKGRRKKKTSHASRLYKWSFGNVVVYWVQLPRLSVLIFEFRTKCSSELATVYNPTNLYGNCKSSGWWWWIWKRVNILKMRCINRANRPIHTDNVIQPQYGCIDVYVCVCICTWLA